MRRHQKNEISLFHGTDERKMVKYCMSSKVFQIEIVLIKLHKWFEINVFKNTRDKNYRFEKVHEILIANIEIDYN